MNLPHDRDHDLERLLSEGGGEFGTLYRRLSQVDPPRRLDRAVLGEAARAVQGRAPRRQRWVVGLGSAAGLVLAAGIAWQIGHEALRETSMMPAHDDVPMVVPVAPITERARQPTQGSEVSSAPDTNASAAAAAPPPPSAARQRAATKPAAPPTARVPTAQPKRSPAPAPAPVPPAAFPAEAEVQLKARPVAGGAAADTADAAKAEAAGARRKEREPRSRRPAPPAPSSSIELRRDLKLAPSAWIAHVRDLLVQGRRQQAIESLQLFQRTHPDRPIPDDLRPLLD